MHPKVSIIIPIYKVEKYIERCVQSLMEQSLSDIEYIFVDDGSPDKSMEILRQTIANYPNRSDRIHIITHETNKGLTAARNTGLAIATGEFIAYCDSDDWVHPQMYEALYNAAVKNQADLAYCDFIFAEPTKLTEYKTVDFSADKIKLLSSYIQTTWTVLWNILARKELYTAHSLRSPNEISYCEDFNLAVKLFYFATKIIKVEQPLYYYNQLNSSSIVHNLNRKTELDERWSYLDIIQFFKEQGALDLYHREMCWRILKSKQEWVLNTDTHQEFLRLHPDSHKYIWSCPYINKKLKIMMWCLTHHLPWITYTMIYARNFKENLIRR